MTSVPPLSPDAAEFSSTRGVVANSAHAEHFSQLLVGMRPLEVKEQSGSSVILKPQNRDEFGVELFKDIHGLDKVMEGMEVASKLNSKEFEADDGNMTRIAETLLRLQVDGNTYFMQTNFVNQRLGELDEHIKAVTRSR